MSFARFILAFIAFVIGIVLVIPAIIIALPVWLASLVRKIFTALKPKPSEWENIIQFDPKLGWRTKPNLNVLMETDGVYRVKTGEDGWRGHNNFKDSDVIVIGDSFVFGQGATDKDYFANLTERAKIKPVGAPGYGAAHYLLLLKMLTAELKGKLVVWLVFTGNDYREAIRPTSYGYRFPFVFYDNEARGWQIQTDHIAEKKLPFNFERGYKTSMAELADLHYKNYLSDYAFGAFEYLAGEAKKHCDRQGAKFAVATIPLWWVFDDKAAYKVKRHCSEAEKFTAAYPDEQTEAICKRHNIPFRAGAAYFVREDFLSNDFHFSRLGNQKVARYLDELCASLLAGKQATMES